MDGLIPDLSPNLYSQGQVGTGYAQVFDTGAPNPFDVYSDYIKKSVKNEEKRQEKLDEFLASVDDIDQPWNVAKTELGDAINTYGDLIASKRAQGTPINSQEIVKSQKQLKDLAKINESNYQKAMKIGTEMQDPLIYTDEERAAFDAEIKAAADKTNTKNGVSGISEVQKVLDKWQKGVETPNVVEDYKKVKAIAKDESGYRKLTTEEDFKKAVEAQLTNYQPPQLKKLLKMYQDENRIDVSITPKDLQSTDKAIRDNALAAIRKEMEIDLAPQKELDVTPKAVSSRSPGTPKESKWSPSGFNKWDQNKNIQDGLNLGNKGKQTGRFISADGVTEITIMPDKLRPVTQPNWQGLAIVGTRAAERGDKGYLTKDEAVNELLPGETVQQGSDGKYYKYIDAKEEIVPLNSENLAALQSMMGGMDVVKLYRDSYIKSGGSAAQFDQWYSKQMQGQIDMN